MASAVTLIQAKTQLSAYLAAEIAVLQGQSYTIKDRTLTRASLKEIREGIKYWTKMVNGLTQGMRVRRAVPRDL